MSDAKRALQWAIVDEALHDARVDADTIALVKHAREVDDAVHAMAQMLNVGVDASKPKNYLKVELVGMLPPFDRAYVELVRPGGMTSHELRTVLRERLMHVRSRLDDMIRRRDDVNVDAYLAGLVSGIDDDLVKEQP